MYVPWVPSAPGYFYVRSFYFYSAFLRPTAAAGIFLCTFPLPWVHFYGFLTVVSFKCSYYHPDAGISGNTNIYLQNNISKKDAIKDNYERVRKMDILDDWIYNTYLKDYGDE